MGRSDRGTARDVAEPLLHLGLGGRDIDVARQHQHRIVRTVIVAEPFLDVIEARRIEIGHRTNGAVVIGVAGREEIFENLVTQQAIGVVVTLALFVLDDAALVIELFLRHRAEQVPHAVAFEEQRAVERAGRHGLEIIGAVDVGSAVAVGRPNLLQRLEKVARRIFRPVEHQMFEQMGKARLALGLMLRPDAVPHRHRDDGRLAILVDDDAQAIVERESFVWNINRLHQIGDRRRIGGLGLGKRGTGGDQRGGYGQGKGEAMETGHGHPLG